ncbi:MAG: MATE family efflux transporter [Lachnospiraceae bacterium]|nr:MATE family efflux transporter [Lachnospiraceae bacterium]
MHSKSDVDMTTGTIWKRILSFTLPLLVGNLFQQFYSTVDSIVVGDFVGANALGAVAATAQIINALIGLFMGFTTGAGVVISQYYGARSIESMRRAIHTAVVFSVFLSVVMTALGVCFTPWMVRAMKTPAAIAPEAVTYLRIYFAGGVGLVFYNMGASILRAVGDSRRPLYFLVLSSVLNVILDLVFVIAFRLGVAGVGYATILSQLISALAIFALLFRTQDDYGLRLSEMKIHWAMLKKIVGVGLPTGFQQSIIAFSNVFVLSYVNAFDAAATAGWGIRLRLEAFIFLPVQSISLATTTFVGQNAGAGKPDRIREGVSVSLKMSALITFVIVTVLFAFAPQVCRVFNQEPEVVGYAVLFLRWSIPFALVVCGNQIYAGALRGVGDARLPMLVMIGSYVLLRQAYLYVVTKLTDSVIAVTLVFPLGWTVCSVIMFLIFHSKRWERDLIRSIPAS